MAATTHVAGTTHAYPVSFRKQTNSETNPRASYRLKQLQLALDALALSEKVAIMVNERGFLKLQFMIDLEAGDVQWIEFYVRACRLSFARPHGKKRRA